MENTQSMTLSDAEEIKVQARHFSSTEVLTFIILLVAIVISISFFTLSGQSLRLDESQSLWQTSHSPLTIITIVAEDVHVPLYHLILHYWQIVFGNGVFPARMLSLIFFVLIIPSIYLLGKHALNQTVGLYAALLAAISPFLNWYGNEIRMYTLFALVTILSQYFFIRIQNQGRGLIWLGYGITFVVGIFTHYFFVFNIIAQMLYFLIYRPYFPNKSFRNFLIVILIASIVFAPWIYFVINLGAAGNTQPLLREPSPADLFNTLFEFVFGFQNDTTNTILISLWPLLVLFVFLSLKRNQHIPPQAIYFFISMLIPIILVYLISSEVKPIYLSRYLIVTLPSLYIFLSWILSSYPPILSRFMKTFLVIGMVAMLAVEITSANSPVKEDYRTASTYLSTNAKSNDIIIVSAPFTIYPFEYYYNGEARVATLPIWDRNQAGPIPSFSNERLENDVQVLADAHEIIWVLLSYDQGYEEDVRLYFDTHFERIDKQNFSPGLNLYAYKLRYDIESFEKVMERINAENRQSRPTNAKTAPANSLPAQSLKGSTTSPR